jgi:uncharacterized membrane-anchored protein YjiN (DUF445 family)
MSGFGNVDPAGLTRMKRLATAMFVAVSIGFVVTLFIERSVSWVGYLRATFEAAMVGAIADWFAVTALFRHPLGLAIPHTAIIAERKNEIGEGLGQFVQENFLTPEVLGVKIRSAAPTDRALAWLQTPGNDQRVVNAAQSAALRVLDRVDDKEVEAFLAAQIRARLDAIPASATAAKLTRALTDNGRTDEIVDSVLFSAHQLLWKNHEVLAQQFLTQSPWWVPGSIDSRVFERLFEAAGNALTSMRTDYHNPLRLSLLRSFDGFVQSLENDPVLINRGEKLKGQLLDHPQTAELLRSSWGQIKAQLREELSNPNSRIVKKLKSFVVEQTAALHNDPQRRAAFDERIEGVVVRVVREHGHEVANLISSTVQRWDTKDTVQRIEANIGRDLQFIRINGTVVGGLAGLVIYTLSRIV